MMAASYMQRQIACTWLGEFCLRCFTQTSSVNYSSNRKCHCAIVLLTDRDMVVNCPKIYCLSAQALYLIRCCSWPYGIYSSTTEPVQAHQGPCVPCAQGSKQANDTAQRQPMCHLPQQVRLGFCFSLCSFLLLLALTICLRMFVS